MTIGIAVTRLGASALCRSGADLDEVAAKFWDLNFWELFAVAQVRWFVSH